MLNLDSIDKITKKCGCVITSKLNIIENEITEYMVIICKKCFLIGYNKMPYTYNKMQYTYNKSQNVYISNSEISDIIIKKKIKKISSDIDILNIKNENNSNILKFGKYKHKSFDYVYNNDKIYCYNLSFWKHNNIKNEAISDFVNFVRDEIKAF
jgi:methionine synthase II (cobalamin-independent)